jgi:hypothetical protein
MGAVTQAAAMQAAAIARNSVKLEYGALLSKPRPQVCGTETSSREVVQREEGDLCR